MFGKDPDQQFEVSTEQGQVSVFFGTVRLRRIWNANYYTVLLFVSNVLSYIYEIHDFKDLAFDGRPREIVKVLANSVPSWGFVWFPFVTECFVVRSFLLVCLSRCQLLLLAYGACSLLVG